MSHMGEGQIGSWRLWYESKVRQYCKSKGIKYNEMSVSAEGAHYLLQVIDEAYNRAPRFNMTLLEMGAGFSTLVLSEWSLAHPGVRMVSVDHDKRWVDFIGETLRCASRELVGDVEYPVSWRETGASTIDVIDRVKFETVLRSAPLLADVIFVDHGPTMDTRAADVPWLVGMLKPAGIMLFDDWRPKHEGRIRRAFAALGGSWHIEAPEHIKRYPTDKSIAMVRRAEVR